MNMRSRKTKGLSLRLLALLLCCACLFGVAPSAIATDVASAAEESVVEPTTPADQTDSTPSPESTPKPDSSTEPAEKTPADELFDRIMACENLEELSAILENLTENDEALMDEFTDAQNDALSEKMDELGYNAVETLKGSNTQTYSRTIINNVTNAEVAYVKIESNGNYSNLTTASNSMTVELKKGEAIVFFVKPENGYLLTKFYRSENEAADLYSVETSASESLFGFFKNNSETGQGILNNAINSGYVGYYGFTNAAKNNETWTFYEVAEAPQMSIRATASPNANLKPGDKVTFTITVTPGNLSTGQNYTVTETEITSLTINETSYDAKKNNDGTYSVEYTITESDWETKKATLSATASLTYNYALPVKDRENKSGTIKTSRTISSTATTECEFATKKGVLYQLSYDAPEGITPPNTIPAAPTDDQTYFENRNVSVAQYNTDQVDDPQNLGTWTFTGWTYGDKTYKAGDVVEMTGGGLIFKGVWKFTQYPDATLTIKKTLSGNMQDVDKQFTFTVTANKDVTCGEGANKKTGKELTFQLKKDESVNISIPVGANVSVSEDSDGYTYSLSSETTIKSYTNLSSGSGISFTMPKDNSTVVFNNDKTVTIDTGVILDKIPYILILAFVLVGLVAITRRRRSRADD